MIRVLAVSQPQLQAVVVQRPRGFGDQPETYHSDAVFVMGIPVDEAMAVFKPRDGVDQVWAGDGVIYSQRLSAQRTKSRLGQIVGTAPYKSLTIRSWATVKKLLTLLDDVN